MTFLFYLIFFFLFFNPHLLFSTNTPLFFEKFHCGLMKWETNGFGSFFSFPPLFAVPFLFLVKFSNS
jgi:hypothetical protein